MISLDVNRSIQREFAGALLSGACAVPGTVKAASREAAASRFGVYRNNVLAGLLNALAVRYPVTRNILWDEAFDRAARRYILSEPPTSPVLHEYGEDFPAFLRRCGDGAASQYVADVAALESSRVRAFHAADATPVEAAWFARWTADQLPAVRLRLHPSVTILQSRFPIVSAWELNGERNGHVIAQWKPEAAMISRPMLDVEVRRLAPGTDVFLLALSEGQSIGAAVTRARQVQGFELADAFGVLVTTRIVAGAKSFRLSATDMSRPSGHRRARTDDSSNASSMPAGRSAHAQATLSLAVNA